MMNSLSTDVIDKGDERPLRQVRPGKDLHQNVLVVSIPKSGTHLVDGAMRSLGYRTVGKMIWPKSGRPRAWNRRPFPEILRSLESDRSEKVCVITHHLPLVPGIQELLDRTHVRIVFNHRDPRGVALSQYHYLLGNTRLGVEGVTPTPFNLAYSKTLREISTLSERVDYLVFEMLPKIIERFFKDHLWLLHHPRVFKTSFETLVGPCGGGDGRGQCRTVEKLMNHLAETGEAQSIAEDLFDKNVRTFRNSRVDEWETFFSEKYLETIDDLYGDILDAYGYPRWC
jgi:hypothetical protein